MSEKATVQFLLSLLNKSIHPSAQVEADMSGIDWKLFDTFAARSMTVPMLYDVLADTPFLPAIPADMMERWKTFTFFSVLKEYAQYQALRAIISGAQAEDIPCVLFKGCVLADLYPKYASRITSDSDIYVGAADKDSAIRLLERLGYIKSEEHSKEEVYVYFLRVPQHTVELHFSLWEEYSGPILKQMESLHLTDEHSWIRIEACGMPVKTLGYTQHLIYQIFHMVKHFALEGANLRHLVDLTLYLERYEPFIDYQQFWKAVDALGYAPFCEHVFTLCRNYLDLKSAVLDGRADRTADETEFLLLDMAHVGYGFAEKNAGWQVLGIMTPYFAGMHSVPKTKLGRWLCILFPVSGNLPKEYAYATRHPVLLPIAWAHKNLAFLHKWRKNRKDWYTAREKLAVAERRLSLMLSLGLGNSRKF